MRLPSNDELKALALLRQMPLAERELQQTQVQWSGAIGVPLPVIHQVLSA